MLEMNEMNGNAYSTSDPLFAGVADNAHDHTTCIDLHICIQQIQTILPTVRSEWIWGIRNSNLPDLPKLIDELWKKKQLRSSLPDHGPLGTFAYLITRAGARQLLRHTFPLRRCQAEWLASEGYKTWWWLQGGAKITVVVLLALHWSHVLKRLLILWIFGWPRLGCNRFHFRGRHLRSRSTPSFQAWHDDPCLIDLL